MALECMTMLEEFHVPMNYRKLGSLFGIENGTVRYELLVKKTTQIQLSRLNFSILLGHSAGLKLAGYLSASNGAEITTATMAKKKICN